MKLPSRIIKYQHIVIPLLVLSIAVNAASIIEKDNDLLDGYEQSRINSLVNLNKVIETNKTVSNVRQKKDESPITPLEINESKTLNRIEAEISQEDKRDINSNSAQSFPGNVKTNFSEITAGAEKKALQKGGGEKKSNIGINYNKINQKGMIENSQQLKMLAHNLFGDDTLEDLIVTQQDVKNLFYQADAWVKDVLFDDSQWRLEDSIYGSAAILFINDSSLIKFLRKFDTDPKDLKQITKNFENNSQIDNNNSSNFESDSALLKGYFSILDFIKKYGGFLVYTLLSIVIIREIINLIAKALKPKNKSAKRPKQDVRRRSSHERTVSLNSSNTDLDKGNQIATTSTNNDKSGTPARRRHRGRKNRPKRSVVRKILDNTFGNTNNK